MPRFEIGQKEKTNKIKGWGRLGLLGAKLKKREREDNGGEGAISRRKNVIYITLFMGHFLTYHPSTIGWGVDPTLTWAHTPSNGGWVVCQKVSHKKSGTNNITLLWATHPPLFFFLSLVQPSSLHLFLSYFFSLFDNHALPFSYFITKAWYPLAFKAWDEFLISQIFFLQVNFRGFLKVSE